MNLFLDEILKKHIVENHTQLHLPSINTEGNFSQGPWNFSM